MSEQCQLRPRVVLMLGASWVVGRMWVWAGMGRCFIAKLESWRPGGCWAPSGNMLLCKPCPLGLQDGHFQGFTGKQKCPEGFFFPSPVVEGNCLDFLVLRGIFRVLCPLLLLEC